MRLAKPCAAPRTPWAIASAILLPLLGCGDSEGKKGEAAVASSGTPLTASPDAAGAMDAGVVDPMTQEGMTDINELVPFKAQIDTPIEYEEVSQKPLHATFPEGAGPEVRPSVSGLPSDDPLLGRPLVINGKVVPFEEIKKQMCLNTIGVAEISDARIRIFVEEERQRLAAAGESAERTDLGPNDLDGYLKEVEQNIKAEYPEGDVSMDDVYRGLASHDPRGKLETQMLFSKLFMPDDPELFPPLTLEAILKQQGGQAVLDHYKQVFEERKGTTGPIAKDAAELQFDGAIMQQILAHLLEVASVVFEPAEGVLYRINGVDIRTDDIWNRIKDRVTAADVLKAKQWIVNTTLLEDAFKGAGAWLNDEEAYAAYFAHSDPYKDSIFSQERVALMVKQFPSVEYYKHYRRLYDSFQRLRKPSEDVLKAFANKRTNKIMGQVSCDVDVILCSAFELKTNVWKEDGWTKAENRMKDVLNLLVEEQRPWEEMMERYSDFYEPPTPVSQRGFTEENPRAKGHFQNIQRNGLLNQLGESDYGIFLSGACVTDFIFFEQEVGTLGQPMRGPWGWYMPRLFRRTRPPERIPMDETTMRDLILDDYLTTELNAFAQELIQKSEVYGLVLPGSK